MIYEKREDRLLSSESGRYPTLIENQMTWNKEFPGRGGRRRRRSGPEKMSSALGALQFLRNAEFISFPRRLNLCVDGRGTNGGRRIRKEEEREETGLRTTVKRLSARSILPRFDCDMKRRRAR